MDMKLQSQAERIRNCSGVIFAAGGHSSRFDGNKLFATLRGMPLFSHCIRRFAQWLSLRNCVLVVPQGEQEDFRRQLDAWGLGELPLTEGGATRFASVKAGLTALPEAVSLVAVQDAARPLTPLELLQRCLVNADQCGSGVAAHHVVDTIKVASPRGLVLETPDRRSLWATETPQAFRRDWLEAGYNAAQSRADTLTDDTQAVQLAGHPVLLVENHAPNLKVTYPQDLVLAEALLAQA